jgi:predicted nucleic acid-binding protein
VKLYLDMNVYNRIFDDQNQIKIKFETMAISVIFELVEKKMHELVWSFMLKDENYGNPYSDRREYVAVFSTACAESVEPNIQIREIASEIMKVSSAKPKDSLHLACAIYSKCDCFITCDDRLIRTINANINSINGVLGNIKIMNPIDFLREEMKIDVIE